VLFTSKSPMIKIVELADAANGYSRLRMPRRMANSAQSLTCV